MSTPQDIADQQRRLGLHRANVQLLLGQIAMHGGWMLAPLIQLNTLTDNRKQIARCKAILHEQGVQVEDHPDDQDINAVSMLEQEAGELEAALRLSLPEAGRRLMLQRLDLVVERLEALRIDAPAHLFERALTDYLRKLRHACSPLQLGQIDQSESRLSRAMRLEQVYIDLNIQRQIRRSPAELAARARERRGRLREKPTRAQSVLEVLAHDARLVLLGAPGSGKSTFVNHLTLCLAGAVLCERHPDEPQPPGGWLARLPGWRCDGALLPVRVVLRELAAFAPLAQAPHGSAELVLDFVRAMLGSYAAALEPLAQALTDGRAILLFDGLDEVSGEPTLTRVVECIDATVGVYARCPALVTCRLLDYQTNPRRHLRGFAVETLAALDGEQINQFVDSWYEELLTSGRQARGKAPALQRALASRADLATLARLPLLLTMMAIVHADQGALLEARALLYAECVELLLLRWRQEPGQPELLEQLGLPQFYGTDLLVLMARLGYAAHQQAEGAAQDERPADLTRAQVFTLLSDGFEPYAADDEHRDRLASRVLHAIATRNGLLLKQSGEQGEVYTFPHRTFQEFLAAYYLKTRRDCVIQAARYATQAHWNEVLTLLVGYLVHKEQELDRPILLAERLLRRTGTEPLLAGELLVLIGRGRVYQYDTTLLQPGELWHRARDVLLRLSTQSGAAALPVALRCRAGLVLGQLCYGSTAARYQGMLAPLPDPRLPLSVLGQKAEYSEDWWQALDSYWCAVGPGPFWSGDDRASASPSAGLTGVVLPYAYRIGRFPITNADYACFVAAGGYKQWQWWHKHGQHWRQTAGTDRQPLSQPMVVDLPEYNNPLQPAVGITWYEAAAYCLWLTEQGRAQGWLPPEDEIRLPTALEWERAARDTDRRRYPWGDAAPDPERANYDDTRIDRPSPVGCFPAGQAACGALDLAGNVWEWVASSWQQPHSFAPLVDPEPSTQMVWAGGAFCYGSDRLCCGAFNRNDPGSGGKYLGFRVVWSPRADPQ